MNHHCLFILLLSILILGSSCTQGIYYRTKSTHFLGVDEKGDIAVSGASDFETDIDRQQYHHFQAAYSPIEHLAFSTSYSFFTQKKEGRYIEGNDFDFAVGMYTASFDLDKSAVNLIGYESITFDAYLSYGQGQFSKILTYRSDNTLFFNRYALQLGMHYQNNFGNRLDAIVKVGLVYRPTLLEFTKFTNIFDPLSTEYRYADLLIANNKRFMHEMAFQTQIGIKEAQLFLNYSRTHIVNIDRLGTNDVFQLGILLNINEFMKKRNQ